MASSSSRKSASSEAAVKGVALFEAAKAGNIDEVTKHLGKKADINYVYKWLGADYLNECCAQTPLMAAVHGGHSEVVKFLLYRKANVNLAEPESELTALHYASANGDAPMIELLMSKGAKPDVRGKNCRVLKGFRSGVTPLHLATSKGHKEAVACLLEHGADINGVDDMGCTPLAIAVNDDQTLVLIDLLLRQGADPNLHDRFGRSALHHAAIFGQLEVVQRLIDAGADVKQADQKGFTPLCKAAQCGNLEMVEYLVRMGADVTSGAGVWTPLHSASTIGCREISTFLLGHGADVNALTGENWTPLLLAVKSDITDGNNRVMSGKEHPADKHLSYVKLLLLRGADPNLVNNRGQSALHHAAMNGFVDSSRSLLDRGADINAVDDEGDTPLMKAADHNRLPLVELLLLRGADPNLIQKKGRKSALIHAAEMQNLEMVQLLTDYGADLNAVDDTGSTPLMMADMWMDNPQLIDLLLLRGADPNVTDIYTRSVLNRAAGGIFKSEVVQILVDGGADVNQVDKRGDTPLIEAASAGRLEVVKYLVDKGADIDHMNKEGLTALHWAASEGCLEMVKFLVLKGANVLAGLGWTPLESAIYAGKDDVAEYLSKASTQYEEFGTAARQCKVCGKIDERNKKCALCQIVYYCGSECANKDWKDHKVQCDIIQAKRKVYREKVTAAAGEKFDKKKLNEMEKRLKGEKENLEVLKQRLCKREEEEKSKTYRPLLSQGTVKDLMEMKKDEEEKIAGLVAEIAELTRKLQLGDDKAVRGACTGPSTTFN